jgi:hypothetical protein
MSNDLEEPEDRLGMTDAQWVEFQRITRGYGDQDENGIDLSRLRDNLKLNPTQRVERCRSGARFMRDIRHAGRLAGLSRHP